MDEGYIKRAATTDIVNAIDKGLIPYAPAWWHIHGREIRKIGRWRIFYIEVFDIGDFRVDEGIYYLDERILKVEMELNKKAILQDG